MTNLVKDQPSVAFVNVDENYKIDEEIFNQTINQLITNKTVVRLTFHNTNINHQHTYTISQMLMKNNTIEILNLNENYNIGDIGTCNITNALKYNHSIKEIYLDNVNMSDQGACSIGEFLASYTDDSTKKTTTTNVTHRRTINVLSLEYNEITDKCMYITTNNNNNNNNKIYNPITSQRFQYGLCDGMLKTSINILELNLNGNDLGNNGIKCLCNALSNMKKDGGGMKILHINRNHITNQGFEYIATMLSTNNINLEIINLNNNRMEHDGEQKNMIPWLQMIYDSNNSKKKNCMKELSIRHNLFDRDSIQCMKAKVASWLSSSNELSRMKLNL